MAKTLADMTAEERADCVGMWALIEGISLAVITEADETSTCVVIYPEWQSNTVVHLNEMVAPRYDLPRAWTPDGEPIPAKEVRESIKELTEETWEYAAQAKTGSKWEYMQDGFFRDAWFSELRKAKGGARELRSMGRETRIVRRRVSPPEVINE